MEYVIVAFPSSRYVYIDGARNGRTNEILRVDEGTHVFDLGPLGNYRPGSRKVTVEDTTPLGPLEIDFYRKEEA